MEENKELSEEAVQTKEYVQYAIAFEKSLSNLEAKLHSVEEPEEIAMGALIAGAEFYDGDWCGIIEGDLEMEAWGPVLWYDRETQGMTETAFRDLEDTRHLEKWIAALHECKPVIIKDTSIYKETNPVEYEIYSRCKADSILAVPFWKNPIGYMIVRNPKRFFDRSSFLQVLAYVAFSSVTEKKLLERSRRALWPERIQKDTDVIINLFGKMEIITANASIDEEELKSPKAWRMIAYMVLNRKHPYSANALYEALWSEEELDTAYSRMKTLVYRLMHGAMKDILKYPLIISTPQGYQLNPEINIMTDIDLFDEYLEQAQSAVTLQTKIELLKNAVQLYKGDVAVSASGDHWLLPIEIAYKYKCLGTYIELMKSNYDLQNYAAVEHYAMLARKIEPSSVDAYYWKIRALNQKSPKAYAKGELKTAEYMLEKEEFEELVSRLESAKEFI